MITYNVNPFDMGRQSAYTNKVHSKRKVYQESYDTKKFHLLL